MFLRFLREKKSTRIKAICILLLLNTWDGSLTACQMGHNVGHDIVEILNSSLPFESFWQPIPPIPQSTYYAKVIPHFQPLIKLGKIKK